MNYFLKIGLQHKLVLILVVGAFFSHTQEVRSVHIQKEYNEMDYAPQISGYFDGEIPAKKICDVNGITTKKGWQIVSFELSYFLGPDEGVRIAGNQIPDTLCVRLQTQCLGTDVYFNKIKAVSDEGTLRNLTPMRLRPIE